MKRLFILMVMTCVAGFSYAQSNPMEGLPSDKGYIEVNGYNKSEVAPDKIFISFQIDEKDTKGKVALATMERDMIKALEKTGVNVEKQLTVNDMSSNFQKYILKRQEIMNTRNYQLVVPDAKSAANVFAALESTGVSNATITGSEYSKMEELRLENKVKAAKNAQEKAAALAGAVGQSIGKAIYIQDTERFYAPRPYNGMMMAKSASFDTAESAPMPNIEFEKISVESNVTIRFILQ